MKKKTNLKDSVPLNKLHYYESPGIQCKIAEFFGIRGKTYVTINKYVNKKWVLDGTLREVGKFKKEFKRVQKR